ncbi:multidrug efflux SMR transporter [Ammoniphilus sp. YIM 78166]|uniref:DMT family transporter n=1 Tax=Ammoniphilus sp. YIM 78166 TaxID=1644106 RepID=UPI001F0F64D5|nr:SMR family transporter [Ammoniphilus sp. YIM 78166]
MEVVWCVIGITKVYQSPSVTSYSILVGGFLSSFIFLALAMKGLAMGTAYAVWTGIGKVGSALVGMFIYGEPKNKSTYCSSAFYSVVKPCLSNHSL